MDFALYVIEIKSLSQDNQALCPCTMISGVIQSRNKYCSSFAIGDQVFIFVPDEFLNVCENEENRTVQIQENFIIPKNCDLNHEVFVGQMRSLLRTLNALHYCLGVLSGESVFIVNPPDVITINAAVSLGLNVFWSSKEEIKSKCVKILGFPEQLLSETGGLGVNHILDFSLGHNSTSKKAILDCLAIRGKLAIRNPDFQLDPPESQILYLKSSSICYFNENSWAYNGLEQSKFLHLLSSCLKYIKHQQ